jgi:hypothetical protein
LLQRKKHASFGPPKQKIYAFFYSNQENCTFILITMQTALQKICSCHFNQISPHRKEVALHILRQLQIFLGQHLNVSPSLLWVCPLETLLSPFHLGVLEFS